MAIKDIVTRGYIAGGIKEIPTRGYIAGSAPPPAVIADYRPTFRVRRR